MIAVVGHERIRASGSEFEDSKPLMSQIQRNANISGPSINMQQHQRQINQRRAQQNAARESSSRRDQKNHGTGQLGQAEQQSPDQQNTPARQSNNGRQQTHRQKHQAVTTACRGRSAPVGSTTGQHLQAGRGVLTAIDPGDRHEVRKLPEKHDQEQRPTPAAISGRARRRTSPSAPASRRRPRRPRC